MNETLGTEQPITIVLFGATGDLAQKKLLPALFALHARGILHTDFHLIGFSRKPWGDKEGRQQGKEGCGKVGSQNAEMPV